jgi:AmmeMemoRadiSam system protein B
MPSPLRDRPGLLLRDPLGYTDAVVVIPTPLVPCLALFDGRSTELDLRQRLVGLTGQLEVGELLRHLVDTLDQGGFLENETFARARDARHATFASAAVRQPAHAGGAYPADAAALTRRLDGWMRDGEPRGNAATPAPELLAIAAPHVSPEGGFRSYRAAFACLTPALRERTFLVLGTSHYGEAERFGLTRKPYATPLGEARTHADLVERLIAEGGPAVALEDYCHAVEHAIEFQVVFLQHAVAPDVRVVPILCGPFARALSGGIPEDDPGVARFLEKLASVAAAAGEPPVWVLGIDLAHIGRRYGDAVTARAEQGLLAEVAQQDRERLARVEAGDAAGFWRLCAEDGDALRWCGSSALYSFLRAVPAARGRLLRYEQWNIDPESVVSFAAMEFHGERAGQGA